MALTSRLVPFLLSVVVPFGAVGLSRAEDPNPITDKVFPTGEERCFAGVFSPKHKGQVTDLYLYRLLRPDPAHETIEDSAAVLAELDREYPDSRSVSVAVKYNDHAESFVQTPSCLDYEGRISCGVDCDGGGFTAKEKEGKLSLDFSEYGMVVRGGCGAEDETEETRMLKNTDFPASPQLIPQPLEHCLKADERANLSFARELVSLRERIQTLGWTCLKRSYDAAHLRKNPHQNIASIAVSFTLKIAPAEEIGTDVTLAARASITSRDGKTSTRDLSCYAGEYEFTCDEAFRLKRRDATSALLIPNAYTPDDSAERTMMGLAIGTGDDVFRLDASAGGACDVR